MRAATWCLGVAAVLTLTPAQAWAASVMWEETTSARLGGWWSSTSWTLHGSFKDTNECEAEAIRRWSHAAAGVPEIQTRPLGYSTKTATGSVTHRFLCLPDTIDPRGPKTK